MEEEASSPRATGHSGMVSWERPKRPELNPNCHSFMHSWLVATLLHDIDPRSAAKLTGMDLAFPHDEQRGLPDHGGGLEVSLMKTTLLGHSIALVAAMTAACSGAEQNGNGGSGGESAAGGSEPGVTIIPWLDTGSDTGQTSTGRDPGGPCGGASHERCLLTEYCDYPGDTCAPRGAEGVCTPKPDMCPDVMEPVCACDGKVYDNACIAELAGVDIQTLGGCPAPDGTFPCGAEFCEAGAEFCQIDLPGSPGDPTAYACVALPANCLAPGATCGCLADLPCANSCAEDTLGGFTLTCP